MSEVIVRMEMPTCCIWVGDDGIHKCPLLDDNDCCRGQSNEANEASETWSDLRKGCPIVGVLPEQHGRLIDASTVIGAVQDEEDNDVPVTVDELLSNVRTSDLLGEKRC